jgi:hypothetical protein
MSWKAEVIADNSGKWSTNALRFATEAEAIGCAKDLYARWTMVREYRATEREDPVNTKWDLTRPEREPLPRAPEGQELAVEVIKPEDIGRLFDDLTG